MRAYSLLMRPLTSLLLVFLTAWIPAAQGATGDPTALHLKVVEGDGATYAPGTRATRGITVIVLDENDRPVDGATVGFSLPMSGPGGQFASGAKTEVITTRGDGKAAAWGMRWNGTAGPFEIRVSAIKGAAKTSITVTQYLSGLPQSSSISGAPVGGGSHKWLWIVLAGAAAAGGAGLAMKSGSSSSGTTAASTTASGSAVQIGAPSISVLSHP
jgi:hypothetical protein